VKKYYDKENFDLNEYTEAQINRHSEKKNTKRSSKYYYKKLYEELIKFIKPFNGSRLKMICLGTRNNNEKEIWNNLLNKKIITNVKSLDIAPNSNADYIMNFNKFPEEWGNKWDIIFSNSIDHAVDASECFTEWIRILKPHGLLYVLFDKHSEDPNEADCCTFEEKDITEMINHNLSITEVLRRFEDKGNYHLIIRKK